MKNCNLIDNIIAYEDGCLDWDSTIELFQCLVDNGMAWTLQGHYGRVATDLIQRGLIQLPEQVS